MKLRRGRLKQGILKRVLCFFYGRPGRKNKTKRVRVLLLHYLCIHLVKDYQKITKLYETPVMGFDWSLASWIHGGIFERRMKKD
jgi:hypothetical protein